MTQQTLFGIEPDPPALPPAPKMHLHECGGMVDRDRGKYRFRCPTCAKVSGWIVLTDDELARGVACDCGGANG